MDLFRETRKRIKDYLERNGFKVEFSQKGKDEYGEEGCSDYGAMINFSVKDKNEKVIIVKDKLINEIANENELEFYLQKLVK
jgi:hypothetical protein